MAELWIHRKCAREGDELVNDPKQSGDSQCEVCTVSAGKVWLHEGASSEKASEPESIPMIDSGVEGMIPDLREFTSKQKAENLTPENDTGEAEEAVEEVSEEERKNIAHFRKEQIENGNMIGDIEMVESIREFYPDFTRPKLMAETIEEGSSVEDIAEVDELLKEQAEKVVEAVSEPSDTLANNRIPITPVESALTEINESKKTHIEDEIDRLKAKLEALKK